MPDSPPEDRVQLLRRKYEACRVQRRGEVWAAMRRLYGVAADVDLPDYAQAFLNRFSSEFDEETRKVLS